MRLTHADHQIRNLADDLSKYEGLPRVHHRFLLSCLEDISICDELGLGSAEEDELDLAPVIWD